MPRCGMNEWITKPIRRTTILEEVTAGKAFLEREDTMLPDHLEAVQMENWVMP
jgi:hypothetical protein